MTVLVLAGTAEARALCAGLAGWDVVASLAGAVAVPLALGVETRVGGFGGEAGFRAYLAEAGIGAVVDATHPFATAITARTVAVCEDLGLPYLRLERPAWGARPGDDWVMVTGEAAVVAHVGASDVVFLATGRQTLERFARLGAARVYCRQIDPPEAAFPFEGGEYVIGRPPFSVEDEVALFARLGVTCLVVKNAGGRASMSKLEAARALGIRVVMLERPEGPVCARVATVEEARAWVANLGVT